MQREVDLKTVLHLLYLRLVAASFISPPTTFSVHCIVVAPYLAPPVSDPHTTADSVTRSLFTTVANTKSWIMVMCCIFTTSEGAGMNDLFVQKVVNMLYAVVLSGRTVWDLAVYVARTQKNSGLNCIIASLLPTHPYSIQYSV